VHEDEEVQVVDLANIRFRQQNVGEVLEVEEGAGAWSFDQTASSQTAFSQWVTMIDFQSD